MLDDDSVATFTAVISPTLPPVLYL